MTVSQRSQQMLTEAVHPPEIMRSAYGPEPCRRAAELPGIMSLGVRELFPDIPREICSLGNDLSAIRKATKEALASVHTDMIATNDTVNILCSEHGFGILGALKGILTVGFLVSPKAWITDGLHNQSKYLVYTDRSRFFGCRRIDTRYQI